MECKVSIAPGQQHVFRKQLSDLEGGLSPVSPATTLWT